MVIPSDRAAWIERTTRLIASARETGGHRTALRLPLSGAEEAALYYYPELTSSNGTLRELAASGAPIGSVVFAGAQTAGRGRHGRTWFSPPGAGLYVSVLLPPQHPPESNGWVTMAAALGLVRVGRSLGVPLQIKWPNDVRSAGRKVAGILAEGVTVGERLERIVVGIGVNVDWRGAEVPPALRDHAVSLAECTRRRVDPDRLLSGLLWEFAVCIEALSGTAAPRHGEAPGIAPEVLARLEHLGERVRIRRGEEEIEGICTGLTAEGYLELDGTRSIGAGELVMPAEGAGI